VNTEKEREASNAMKQTRRRFLTTLSLAGAASIIHLKSGHIAAAGLDVLPVEPPVEPVPELLRLFRAREP
jgi:hypothetical protein